MNNAIKRFAGRTVAVGSLALASVGAAKAELPASVGSAVTAAVTDVGAAGALILGVVVAIAAVKWVRRVVH